MALQFNPYPLGPWEERQRREQRPDFNQTVSQPILQGLGLMGQIQQNNQQQQRQAMLDKYLQSKEQRDQQQFAYDYGTPIDPNITTAGPSMEMGRSSFMPGGQGQVGNPSPLIDQFNRWRAGGMKQETAQPEYMDALGKDQMKLFQDRSVPKETTPNSLEKIVSDKVNNGEITLQEGIEMMSKYKQATNSGSFMLGGVGADGRPIFYNTKNPGKTVQGDVPGGGPLYPKTPSEGQMNASLFGQRANEANQQLESLLKKGFNPTSLKSGAMSRLPNIFQPENIQAYEQVKRNFRNAVLRKESGAAISPSEHAEAERQYFPVAGDSPEVLEFKARNRQTAIEGLGRMAGPMSSGAGSQGVGLMWQGRPLKDTPANRAWLASQGGKK